PSDQGVHKSQVDECRNQPHHPNKQQREETVAESHAQALVGKRKGLDFSRDHLLRSAHLGTSTARNTSSTTWSAVTPSKSASGLSKMRWRSTGRADAFMSSGTT